MGLESFGSGGVERKKDQDKDRKKLLEQKHEVLKKTEAKIEYLKAALERYDSFLQDVRDDSGVSSDAATEIIKEMKVKIEKILKDEKIRLLEETIKVSQDIEKIQEETDSEITQLDKHQKTFSQIKENGYMLDKDAHQKTENGLRQERSMKEKIVEDTREKYQEILNVKDKLNKLKDSL